MIRQLSRSIREYKTASLVTPLLVSGEVVMECLIPFLIAELVNEVNSGCDMTRMLRYGLLLVLMAALSLAFGALAGCTCSKASCGLARNLRKDLFYSIQDYSFENIDHFTTSSLVTRMTTDVTNVQNAYMMIIRTAIRAPLMLVFAFAMAFRMGGRMAWIFLFVVPFLGVGLALDVGQMSALLTYSFMMLNSLMMVSMVFVMITMAGESGNRIAEVLSERSTLTDPPDPVETVADGSVDFDDVSFKYAASARRMVLQDIDLHIRSGETIGIIGGTGSSKSSLIQLICRLYDVTEGNVRVGGVDVRRYRLEALRNQVAVVLQKNVLFSGTIKENLRWGNPDATDEELVEACRLACADEFIRTFPKGYDTYIEQGGTNVSGGQKQRLCIARALLKRPKVLILDDSTSAVDTKTDAAIRKALRTCLPDTTKIIIAQRTASVEDADRILVLDGGRIHGMGTHAQLLRTDAIYREIYTSQNKEGTQIEE